MTRGNYLAAIFGAAVSSFGWFCATDIPIVKVGTALLVAMWAARWVYVYRQASPTVMDEDPRVRIARERYGVDASALYKALDETLAAEHLLKAKLLETAEAIRRFADRREWTR